MKNGNISVSGFMLLILLLTSALTPSARCEIPGNMRVFRVLLIIGDQWEDPAGYVVDIPGPTGEYSGYDATPDVQGSVDFHHIAMLLKSWSIPFDIVRLDQQWLDRYVFLNMQGRPKYGTIIWDVNKSENLLPQDYSIVEEMVRDYGIGIIAISDRISHPGIQDLLGIKYTGSWESNAVLELSGKHFITEGISSPIRIDSGSFTHIQRPQVSLLDGTSALARQGPYAQVTVKSYPSGSHAVWIGNDPSCLFNYQGMRTILRRAITWTIGYNLYKTWENDALLMMDDPGGSANVWLEHWHYAELSEEIIERYLIEPLSAHNAVLNINFVPAFVNDQEQRIEPSWNEKYTDAFGTRQDYISSKKGYDKGVKSGVFEVMSHGLTHMQPDLFSDPGWYGSSLDKEKSEVGWYREFGDTRRKQEIPAAEQLWRMKTSKEWLTEQFDVEPLCFTPGGLGTSVSYFFNTAKLAGEAGYGWYGWEYGYLGKDMVITGWKFFGTPESPLIVPAPPDAHDYGISRQPEAFVKVFGTYPDKRFISINEFIGYLHSRNSGLLDLNSDTLAIEIDYDTKYCSFFRSHSSAWHLEIADWLLKDAGEISAITVDGMIATGESNYLSIPSGTGRHLVTVVFK
jgi:hypothetical protein